MQSLEINKQIENRLTEESLNSRVDFFKQILLNMTIKQHNKFMKKKNVKFDPVRAGTWHSEFNLDEVTKIKNFTLFPFRDKKSTRV
jgi:hypothetical protein